MCLRMMPLDKKSWLLPAQYLSSQGYFFFLVSFTVSLGRLSASFFVVYRPVAASRNCTGFLSFAIDKILLTQVNSFI